MIEHLYKLYLEERKSRLGKTMVNKEILTWLLMWFAQCSCFFCVRTLLWMGHVFFLIHHNHKVTLSDIDTLEIVDI